MRPIRLVVSDVDGTLVDKEKQLTAATGDAVARLERAGIGFTIISARPRSGIMPIADTLGIDRPMGAFNGGIVFQRDGTVIEHHPIDQDVARGAWEALQGEEVDYWVFANDRWHASTDKGVHVDHERLASNQAPVVSSLADMAGLLGCADKITFVSDDTDLLQSLHERIAPRFGDRATIVQSQTYYLDITAREGNKGDGIVALAGAFGASLDETAAIGDQNNDLAMLDLAGYAVAMGNAPDNVKAAADEVSRANDQDGVAWAIDHLILPKTGVHP